MHTISLASNQRPSARFHCMTLFCHQTLSSLVPGILDIILLMISSWFTNSSICGASIRIPIVPPTVTHMKINRSKRSTTLAAYLQSSSTCKRMWTSQKVISPLNENKIEEWVKDQKVNIAHIYRHIQWPIFNSNRSIK